MWRAPLTSKLHTKQKLCNFSSPDGSTQFRMSAWWGMLAPEFLLSAARACLELVLELVVELENKVELNRVADGIGTNFENRHYS